MVSIFMSYASTDSVVIDEISSHLEAVGYSVWVDRNTITAGQLWRARIVEAIENCDVFILALSPNSVVSKHVLQELNIADGEGKPILPVAIAATEIPKEMKLQLAGLQKVSLMSNEFGNIVALYKSINQLAAAKSEAAWEKR